MAIQQGHEDIAADIVDHARDFNVNAVDRYGETALSRATAKKYIALSEKLRAAEAAHPRTATLPSPAGKPHVQETASQASTAASAPPLLADSVHVSRSPAPSWLAALAAAAAASAVPSTPQPASPVPLDTAAWTIEYRDLKLGAESGCVMTHAPSLSIA